MSDYIFLFDMDSTITRKEVLPEISQRINKVDEMRQFTGATMQGEIPSKMSFLRRVKNLPDRFAREVKGIDADIPLN